MSVLRHKWRPRPGWETPPRHQDFTDWCDSCLLPGSLLQCRCTHTYTQPRCTTTGILNPCLGPRQSYDASTGIHSSSKAAHMPHGWVHFMASSSPTSRQFMQYGAAQRHNVVGLQQFMHQLCAALTLQTEAGWQLVTRVHANVLARVHEWHAQPPNCPTATQQNTSTITHRGCVHSLSGIRCHCAPGTTHGTAPAMSVQV